MRCEEGLTIEVRAIADPESNLESVDSVYDKGGYVARGAERVRGEYSGGEREDNSRVIDGPFGLLL